MTITYRVLVVREATARRGILPGSTAMELPPEVLFEAASPDAGRLLSYAPDEVAAALAAVGFAEMPQKVTGLVDVNALATAVVTSAGTTVNGAPPAESAQPVDEPAEQAATPTAKRKRRTRAEIAADEAAARLAAQQEASAAPVDAGPAPQAVAEPVEPAAETTAAPAAAPAPAPQSAPPSAPYNPFA